MLKTAIAAALAFVCLASVAEARPSFCVETGSVVRPSCMGDAAERPRAARHLYRPLSDRSALHAGSVVAHPSGCPARAFCGCGAAVRIFGRPVRALWLASAWFRFPRTLAAPGMAAVRRHHVFVLEQHLSGSTWLAYDANSGRHLTRLHPRSIAGYIIVNPRG